MGHFTPSWYWLIGENSWNPLIPGDRYITCKKHLFFCSLLMISCSSETSLTQIRIHLTSVKSFSPCVLSIAHLIPMLIFLLTITILKQVGDLEIIESRSRPFRDTKRFSNHLQTTLLGQSRAVHTGLLI